MVGAVRTYNENMMAAKELGARAEVYSLGGSRMRTDSCDRYARTCTSRYLPSKGTPEGYGKHRYRTEQDAVSHGNLSRS